MAGVACTSACCQYDPSACRAYVWEIPVIRLTAASISSATRAVPDSASPSFLGFIQRYQLANDRTALRRGLRHEIASLPRPYAFAPSNWSGPWTTRRQRLQLCHVYHLADQQKPQTDDAATALFAIDLEETAVLPEQLHGSRPGLIRCCPAPL
jgi:hypothetical protein